MLARRAIVVWACLGACTDGNAGDVVADSGADGDVVADSGADGDGVAEAGADGDGVAEAGADGDVADVDEIVDPWRIADGVYRLAGLEPTESNADLENLGAIVGAAAVMGLGESVHTSGGFYAAKERVIRWLVAEHGWRVFGMETPRTAARGLDDFIHQRGPWQGAGCDLDPAIVFGGRPIFGVFVDDNTAALFRWLCAWNEAHPDDDVRFFGFDAQQPSDDLAEIAAFALAHGGPGDASLPRCNVDAAAAFARADFDQCMRDIDALEVVLGAVDADERARAELAIAFLSLRAWQEQVFWMTASIVRSYEARDVAMADIFDRRTALDFPGARVIVWAHNYHLAADHPAVIDSNNPAHTRTFGSELRSRRGSDYQPVALTAYRPGIDWPGISDGPEATHLGTSADSIERGFWEALPDEPWILYDTHSEWAPGEVRWRLSEELMVMRDNFAAIIFLRGSPPMNAVLW